METTVLILDRQAEFVVIKLKQPRHAPIPGLSPDLYPFTPIRKASIPYKPHPNDPPIPVAMVQFPLVSAAAVSVYKVQGGTLDGIIIGNWRSPNKPVSTSVRNYQQS